MSVQSSSFFLIFWGSLSSWCKFLQIYGFFVMSESKIKLFRSALHADPQITQYPRKHSCITDRHLLCKNLKLKTHSPSQDFTLRSVIPVIGKEREREREKREAFRIFRIVLYVTGTRSAQPALEENPTEKHFAILDLSLCSRVLGKRYEGGGWKWISGLWEHWSIWKMCHSIPCPSPYFAS